MDFKNIDKKYRPVPFWSWNEKLNVEESLYQTKIMDEAGMGGYFMHARGGLQTEYMGEEWFENIGACIEECNKRGMHAWAYDEDGWPSGFGGGLVSGKGEKYWQKYLRMQPADDDRSEIPAHRILKITDRHCFYYEVNPFYVDTLDPEVTADFINEIYVPYYEKYGTSFDGYFTDEPQISRSGYPWSWTYVEEYKKAYGENLIEVLECLFLKEGSFEDVRIKFWKLTTELFSKNFMKQIYDWCVERGLGFTGHLVCEESLHSQIYCNGACMPHYEYLTIPGMDWLGRNLRDCLTPHQVASVAAQTGKKQILSETFALCGHNVGHDELKRNYEWMMVRGINLMCQHLEGYSNRGLRKRDYPTAMYNQQPWWDEYKVFNDAMSRVGMILAEGRITFDTLLIHNMTSGWICYAVKDLTYGDKDIAYYNNALVQATLDLEAKHIPFHLGDEIMMERHGRVEGNKLIIGEMSYTKVVIPEHIRFLPNTERLLAEFKANGGIVVNSVAELESNDIIDNDKITYTYREFDGFTVHYFVNTNNCEQKAKISKGSYAIDIETGDKIAFSGEYTFPAYGSLVVVDDGTPASEQQPKAELEALDMSGKWSIKSSTMNSLTLDKCEYWFDGEKQADKAYILDIMERACALERAVDVRCIYRVDMEHVPTDNLYLACETPDVFTIKVNGEEIDKTDCGYFRDKAFRLLDIRKHAKVGENVIELSLRFEQSEKTYENLKKAAIFESEKNKFTYDIELESMYLVGDFGVRCDGSFEPIPNDAYFFDGKFTVVEAADEVELSSLEQQGYTFFSGSMTFERKFILDRTDYKVVFNKKGINVIKLTVNGKHVRTVLWAPYEIDLSEYLVVGENTVEITVLNNLRNLLGPHHHANGEILSVSPPSFYHEPCMWNHFNGTPYDERYSFVSTGIV